MEKLFKNNENINPIEQRYLKQKEKLRFMNRLKSGIKFLMQLGLILIIGLYFYSPYSKLLAIEVEGNYYLSKAKIVELSQLRINDFYPFIIPTLVENRIRKSNLVKDVNVRKIDNRVISIDIIEKTTLGYLVIDDVFYWLCEDELVPFSVEEMGFISENILLVGFDDKESQKNIVQGLKKVDPIVRNMISEIHYAKTSFDEQQVKLVMIDGNSIFVSIPHMNLINEYEDLATVLEAKNTCIYFDINNSNAYTKKCDSE